MEPAMRILISNCSISKTLGLNIVFAETFLKEYSTSFLLISMLIDFAIVVF